MKLFIHKFSLLISSILSIFMLISADTTTLDKVDISSIDNTIIEEEIIDNNLVEESVIEELHEEKEIKEEVVEDTKENNSTTSTSISSTTFNNNISSNNTNSNIEQNITFSSTTSTNEIKEEVQENKVTNSYIGVPNPNDFYYSFHHGHIDKNYSTLDACYQKASDVALIDTIDIINTTCYEVLDGQGTILGIYMGVKCNSGNCERYKKMVGIETN